MPLGYLLTHGIKIPYSPNWKSVDIKIISILCYKNENLPRPGLSCIILLVVSSKARTTNAMDWRVCNMMKLAINYKKDRLLIVVEQERPSSQHRHQHWAGENV